MRYSCCRTASTFLSDGRAHVERLLEQIGDPEAVAKWLRSEAAADDARHQAALRVLLQLCDLSRVSKETTSRSAGE